MRIWHNESGSAMIISLLVLLMLGIVGISAIETSNTEMDIADNYQQKIKSLYVAEAGAELAYTILRDTVGWRTGFTDYQFAKGVFDVSLIDSSDSAGLWDTVIVYSTGRRASALTELEVKLAPRAPFAWGAHGDDNLWICGNSMTDSYNSDSGSYASTKVKGGGNVGSNGPVTICGTADIYGSATTSDPGELEIKGAAIVTGDTSSVAPEVIYDPVPQSDFDYAQANTSAPAGLSGTFAYDGGDYSLRVNPHKTVTLTSGIYYFSEIDVRGSIELAPGAQVTIYVTGEIDLAAHASINPGGVPADLLILGQGEDFRFSAHSEIRAVVYAPETDFHMNGQANLYGSFITQTVKDVGGSEFHYDRSLGDYTFSDDLQKVSWREL